MSPNERSSHTAPTPRGGGLVIAAAVLGVACAATCLGGWLGPQFGWFLVGAATIAVVGLLEDVRTLRKRVRFGAQAAAAGLLLWSFGAWDRIEMPFFSFQLAWIAIPLTVLWIVGLTNAYNFMDGIDGIAGVQAIAAACGWIVIGQLTGRPEPVILALPLAAAAAGFLGHNWAPASIFMGDVGSTFLGYVFAALPVTVASSDPRMPFVGLLLVWPFVFDASYTFLRRLARGENVFSPHRSHLYQRLVCSGASHRSVAAAYLLLAGFGAAAACLWVAGQDRGGILAGATPFVLGAALLLCVRHREKAQRTT